jgi:chromosome segregation ATPase
LSNTNACAFSTGGKNFFFIQIIKNKIYDTENKVIFATSIHENLQDEERKEQTILQELQIKEKEIYKNLMETGIEIDSMSNKLMKIQITERHLFDQIAKEEHILSRVKSELQETRIHLTQMEAKLVKQKKEMREHKKKLKGTMKLVFIGKNSWNEAVWNENVTKQSRFAAEYVFFRLGWALQRKRENATEEEKGRLRQLMQDVYEVRNRHTEAENIKSMMYEKLCQSNNTLTKEQKFYYDAKDKVDVLTTVTVPGAQRKVNVIERMYDQLQRRWLDIRTALSSTQNKVLPCKQEIREKVCLMADIQKKLSDIQLSVSSKMNDMDIISKKVIEASKRISDLQKQESEYNTTLLKVESLLQQLQNIRESLTEYDAGIVSNAVHTVFLTLEMFTKEGNMQKKKALEMIRESLAFLNEETQVRENLVGEKREPTLMDLQKFTKRQCID